METKNVLASKTVWVNLITAVVTVVTLFGVQVDLTAEEVTALAGSIVVLVNAVNILLRLFTTKAVTVKKGTSE